MSLSKVKAGNEGVTVETDSRLTEEKRTHERKRNIIILIEKYLLTLGYIDTVTRIEQESNLSLQSWDVADNIDLYMVILEFEQYYEMRFGKLPKMVKKQENVCKGWVTQPPTSSSKRQRLHANKLTPPSTKRVRLGKAALPHRQFPLSVCLS